MLSYCLPGKMRGNLKHAILILQTIIQSTYRSILRGEIANRELV